MNDGTQTISGEIIISSSGIDLENIDVSNLAELDTSDFETTLGPFTSGSHSISVHFQVSGDEDTTNNVGTVSAGVRFSEGAVTLNEFMPQPSSGLTEFVEVINQSGKSVDMENWRIADAVEGSNYLFPSVELSSGSFAVIADDSSLVSFVPDSVPYIVPSAGFPTLNNSSDEIRIFDPLDTRIDSLSYDSDFGYASGVSAEKIFPDSNSMDAANWSASIDQNGMTPGYINSITPREIDGAIVSSAVLYAPLPPAAYDSVTFSIPIRNDGLNQISGNVSVAENNTEIGTGSFSNLAEFDTAIVSVSVPPFPSGESFVSIMLTVAGDMDSTDNMAKDTVYVRFPFETVQINEFMAMPNNDQAEFIELVVQNSVSFKGWSFSDNTLSKSYLPEESYASGDYVVIAADSIIVSSAPAGASVIVPDDGFPALNNSGDGIYLFDLTGSIIDSLIYGSGWPHASEISSEKLRPEFESSDESNWAQSTEIGGMTPGSANSVTLFETDGKLLQDSISLSPQYPASSETSILSVQVVNAGVQSISGTISVEEDDEEIGSASFSSIAFRDTSTVTASIPVLSSGAHPIVISLDVTGDENSSNDIGYYTILVSYPFASVVINEFFSQPDTTQTEFIELYNGNNTNLSGWGISDNTKTVKVFSNNNAVSEYVVIADDDSLLSAEYPNATVLSIPDGFPALNNSADAIYLYDITGFIIDSLIYSEDWPLFPTRSAEKLRPEFTSNDSSRWAVAVNNTGMTPGSQNSVYFEELANAGSILFEPNPFSPDGDGHEDILYMKYKLPYETAVIKIEIFDVVGRSIAAPYWNIYTAQESILTWDGTKKNGEPARIGIYIVKTTARDGTSGQLWEDVQTIVLAKQL